MGMDIYSNYRERTRVFRNIIHFIRGKRLERSWRENSCRGEELGS